MRVISLRRFNATVQQLREPVSIVVLRGGHIYTLGTFEPDVGIANIPEPISFIKEARAERPRPVAIERTGGIVSDMKPRRGPVKNPRGPYRKEFVPEPVPAEEDAHAAVHPDHDQQRRDRQAARDTVLRKIGGKS